ncbi:MAG TPA: helix-turn-helix transcriptional regulator, partial [Trebonia sp.]
MTNRQIDVLRAIASGLSARQIAEEFKISVNTVNTHIKAMKKLAGVSKARHLLAVAVSQQIIDMSVYPPRWTGVTRIRPWP